MIRPEKIQLNYENGFKGLYESFYFRGVSADGQWAFWLKHNLLRTKEDPFIIFDCHFILFNKENCTTKVFKKSKNLSDRNYLQFLSTIGDSWDELTFTFDNSSYYAISSQGVRGAISIGEDEIVWNLQLQRSNRPYYHFANAWFYHGFFPKKKILTRDSLLLFQGEIKTSSGIHLDNNFIGMNGHNWGTEHAYRYSYADCNQFDGLDAYFDGFSAKLSLLKGLYKTPYLSLCSLRINDNWYHFNQVLRSYKHKVIQLTDYYWHVIFTNSQYTLEVRIDGDRPETMPWVSLDYLHPNGNISVVKNTKFAKGRLILTNLENNQVVANLSSDFFELESAYMKTSPSKN